jgi:hypothetical protein
LPIAQELLDTANEQLLACTLSSSQQGVQEQQQLPTIGQLVEAWRASTALLHTRLLRLMEQQGCGAAWSTAVTMAIPGCKTPAQITEQLLRPTPSGVLAETVQSLAVDSAVGIQLPAMIKAVSFVWRRTVVGQAGGVAALEALTLLGAAWETMTRCIFAEEPATFNRLAKEFAQAGRTAEAVWPLLFSTADGALEVSTGAGADPSLTLLFNRGWLVAAAASVQGTTLTAAFVAATPPPTLEEQELLPVGADRSAAPSVSAPPPPPTPTVGAWVVVQGLEKAPQLNGRMGWVVRTPTANQPRFGVAIDTPELTIGQWTRADATVVEIIPAKRIKLLNLTLVQVTYDNVVIVGVNAAAAGSVVSLALPPTLYGFQQLNAAADGAAATASTYTSAVSVVLGFDVVAAQVSQHPHFLELSNPAVDMLMMDVDTNTTPREWSALNGAVVLYRPGGLPLDKTTVEMVLQYLRARRPMAKVSAAGYQQFMDAVVDARS